MNRIQIKNDRLIVNNPSLNATCKHHLKTGQSNGWLHKIRTWMVRKQHRHELLQMPDYLLKDIGLTREEVIEESKTPFWKSRIF